MKDEMRLSTLNQAYIHIFKQSNFSKFANQSVTNDTKESTSCGEEILFVFILPVVSFFGIIFNSLAIFAFVKILTKHRSNLENLFGIKCF